ncbi:MAG: hypothetical protein WCW25_02955 [Patescibacteria group bacterium]|jgi:hypothetical protein
MGLKMYLFIMTLAAVACFAVFSYVAWTVNPEITNWVGFILFYASLFMAITGAAAIFGFVIRFITLKRQLAGRSVIEAFRQSFLFAALVIVALILLSKDLFNWANLGFLVLGLSILEFFLVSYKKAI